MSAGGLARLGVRCADASTGIATLGVYCGALVDPVIAPRPGGGKGRRSPLVDSERSRNYEIALLEDEEIIAALQAFMNRKH